MVIDDRQATLFQPIKDRGVITFDPNIYSGFNPKGKQMFDWIDDYVENNKDNGILGLKLFPGSGKTFIMGNYTSMMKLEYPYIYLSKNQAIVTSFCNFQTGSRKAIHLEGKITYCIDDKGKYLINKYGTNNWYCNSKCEHKEDCQYKLLMKQILTEDPAPSWASHYSEFFLLYENIIKECRPHDKYLLIFDEDFIESLNAISYYSASQTDEFKEHTLHPITKDFWTQLQGLIDMRNHTTKDDVITECELQTEELFIRYRKIFSEDVMKEEEENFDKAIEDNFESKTEIENRNPYMELKEIMKFLNRYDGTPKGFITQRMYDCQVNYFRYVDLYDNCIILNATFEKEIFYNFFPKGVKERNLLTLLTMDGEFGLNQHVYQMKQQVNKSNILTDDEIKRRRKYPIDSVTTLSIEEDGDGHKHKVRDFNEEMGLPHLEWTLYFTTLCNQTLIFAAGDYIKAFRRNEQIKNLEAKGDLIIYDDKTRKKLRKEKPEWKEKEFMEYCATFKIVLMNYERGSGIDCFGKFDGCVLFHHYYPNGNMINKLKQLMFNVDPKIIEKNASENKMWQAINRIRPFTYNCHDVKILVIPSTPLEMRFCKGHEGIQYFTPNTFYSVIDKNHITIKGKNILEYLKVHPNSLRTDIGKDLIINYTVLISELKRLAKSNLINVKLDTNQRYIYNLQYC